MPEVILTGPEGRLEGRYQPGAGPRAPVAILLQPHPAQGTMNHPIVLALYQSFVRRGFATPVAYTPLTLPTKRRV